MYRRQVQVQCRGISIADRDTSSAVTQQATVGPSAETEATKFY